MFLPKNRLFSRIIPGILLVFSLLVMGCPGTTGSPTLELPDGDSDGKGPGGGGGLTGGNGGKTDAERAEDLEDELNGSLTGDDRLVEATGATVTVLKDFNVDPSNITARAAAAINVSSFDVLSGVTFVIPAGKTITVLSSGAITAPGTITVQQTGLLKAASDSTVSVTGSGTIKVENGGTLEAAPSSTVTVASAGTIEVAGTLKATAGSTVTVQGTVKVEARGTLEAEAGSTVTVAKLDANGGDIKADPGTVKVTQTLTVASEAAAEKVGNVTLGENATKAGNADAVAALGPVLKSTVVNYDPDSNAVSVTFTFDKEVTVTDPSEGVTGSGSATITVTPTGTTSGTAVDVSVTVSADEKTTTVKKTVMPVENGNLPNTGTYSVVSYDAGPYKTDSSVVVLNKESTKTAYLITNTTQKALFNAIYTPNATGTEDTIESGKTTVPYTDEISTAALALFQITFDGSGVSKVEIKGTTLPTATSASNENPIVIDIGLPGTVDNTDLPTFYIPYEGGTGLGDGSTTYAGVRLRVNKGAELVVLADNTNFPSSSAPEGKFKNGTVEVMAGGKLRDGAYEGFPLGSNAVILNRAGSYLAVGPESEFTKGDSSWWSGWLIGPSASSDQPRIKWDNDQGYIEVRPGKLAISANVTVKKTLALIYSVWFVGGPTITIDTKDHIVIPLENMNGEKGLFAGGAAFKFYGTATPATRIVLKQGSSLHKIFLTEGVIDAANFITADSTSGDITITNLGTSNEVKYPDESGKVSGYLDWTGYPVSADAPDGGQPGGQI